MQSHEHWLAFAKYDLISAKTLLENEIFSTCVYHCQQCAEKSLKAYLAYRQQPLLKTHDLIFLVNACKALDIKFEQIMDEAKHLKPFATEFRYPSEYEIPDLEDATVAYEHAKRVFNFVTKKLT